MKDNHQLYVAKTFAGLEPLLAKELSDLGAREVTMLRRAVSFSGDLQTLYRANIWCRTALSILRQLHKFSFENKEDFYEQMRKVDWPSLFDKDKTILVVPVAHGSDLFINTMYLAQLSKDAIADAFMEKYNSRPNVDTSGADIRINVHVLGNQCTVSLDSSGEALFKRGYRRASGPAPINEILAAGLIMLSEWDLTSPFVDPMCGSGTFSIEAALMSSNTAPAAGRKMFGFMQWPDFDAELLENERADARSKERKVQADIMASDNMGFMLDHARQNIMHAGFMGSIRVQKNDFFRFRPPFEKGWVLLNPPYGKRMAHRDIIQLHRDIGEALKHRYTGFRAGIISSETEAMKAVGLRPDRKIQVYNGPLQCVFNVYDLFRGKLREKDEAGKGRRHEAQRGRSGDGSAPRWDRSKGARKEAGGWSKKSSENRGDNRKKAPGGAKYRKPDNREHKP